MIRRVCILLSVLVGALSASADLFITPEPDFVKNGYLCTYLMPTGDDTEISGVSIVGMEREKQKEVVASGSLSFPEIISDDGVWYTVKWIGRNVFNGSYSAEDLSGITDIVLNNSLQFLAPGAISDVSSAERLFIGGSMIDIAYGNFCNMVSLREIHFVKRCDHGFADACDHRFGFGNIFRNSPLLKDVYVYDIKPFDVVCDTNYSDEYLNPAKCTLHVPA